MSRRLAVLGALVAAALTPVMAAAQDGPPAASQEFTRIYDAKGLPAALAQLRTILADTTGAWRVDAIELVAGLPVRLAERGRAGDAVALVAALEEHFGDHPRYWSELAGAHLRAGDPAAAERALRRSLDLDPGQDEVAWKLAHLDELAAVVKVQVEAVGRYAPGQATGLRGPYVGQTPPGAVPEVFAPGLVGTLAHEYSITFMPDGREILFSRGGLGTFVTRETPDGWTFPEPLTLIDDAHLTEEAGIAADGRRVFFCARPRDMRGEREIWVAPRVEAGWGAARRLFQGMYPTAALDGTLYYTDTAGRPDYGAIVCRRPEGDGWADPVLVDGPGINTPAPDAHPFISPDGCTLIFDSYRDEAPGLYVAFRGDDGAWGPAHRLGEEYGIPFVGQGALSPDGKYLFFCLAGDLYWMDAGFLAELRETR